jgi:signal transduction histidine kinase
MNDGAGVSNDLRLWSFLEELKNNLRAVREDRNALRLMLRRSCEYFDAEHGCIAVARMGETGVELIAAIPRGGDWDLDLLGAVLRSQRPRMPRNIITAPIQRRGRLWAVAALRREPGFEIPASYAALRRMALALSEAMDGIDRERNIAVRNQIDRKILEQLRPQDLFYQILHGLRSLIHYDHSSALLIFDRQEKTLELVAEQIAWEKGKSRQIGLKLPLGQDLSDLLRHHMVYGYTRRGSAWEAWSDATSIKLAELLDYNKEKEDSVSKRRESGMLCAPLTGREGVVGVLKVAACRADSLGAYEADLVRAFTPLAAVSIQNSRRAVILEGKMVEAEKKHAVANLLRGVSHDVNNALGSILPLVQQLQEDVRTDGLQRDALEDDLQQIEQSIQTCRRIFGGMLAFSKHTAQVHAQGNVRRALDSALAILRDGFERRGIHLDVRLDEGLPNIQAGQGDLEQLFLNLATNARDAMPTGGTLSIEAGIAGDRLSLRVRDTGCGISPPSLSRIQEPFFTTKQDGNGLGLSICRSIVWNAGGQMRFQSEPGLGTEVHIDLPIEGKRRSDNSA